MKPIVGSKFLKQEPTCGSKLPKPTIGLETNTRNIIFSKIPTVLRKFKKTWDSNTLRGQA